MNILYTCDNNYIWLMGISMISLFENAEPNQDITVYLIGENIANDNLTVLERIVSKYSQKIVHIPMPELNIPDVLCSERWPKSAYTRMFAAEILPEDVNQIVYLDCDVIVCKDISGIGQYLKKGTAFCGVKDCISKYYKTNIGLRDGMAYINAGVMVIDLEELRKIDVRKHINDFLKKYGPKMNYADQDLLNGCFYEKISTLPLEYDVMTSVASWSFKQLNTMRKPDNFYSEKDFEDAKKTPRIIHYTTNMLTVRPWFKNSNHPYKDIFEKYRIMSPWSDMELKTKVFTGKKNQFLKVMLSLPKGISYWLLGLTHAVILPIYRRGAK